MSDDVVGSVTFVRAVVTDSDGFTIIPLAPEAEPDEVEGSVSLWAHSSMAIEADEFERFMGIHSSGGTDALAAELRSRGFKGASMQDGKMVAWRTAEQDEADGKALARGDEIRVGCLVLGMDCLEGEEVRLDLSFAKAARYSLEDAESLQRVLASFIGHYDAKGVSE